MKPFVKAVVSGNEFLVVSSSSDGVCFSRFKYRGAANQKRNKINAAFEARLKEEMEKLRERAAKIVDENVEGYNNTDSKRLLFKRNKGNLSGTGYADAIRALPLFETEEKP